MTNLYNKRIKPCTFRAGDLVLRKVFENTPKLEDGKFQPNWEGPYVIVRVGPAGSYALNKLDRVPVLECGMLCTLKGITTKVFFKGLSIKFPLEYSLSIVL